VKHERDILPASRRRQRHRKRKALRDVERVYDLILKDSLRTLLIGHRKFRRPELPETKAEGAWRVAVAEVATKALIDYFENYYRK
jgi:hypothetical protein